MLQIRDCTGRLACVVDPETGQVEQVYKGCKTRTTLQPGCTFTIEREGIVTAITRTETSAVEVTSKRMTA